MFWLIFYQNLPDDFGLNRIVATAPQIAGPSANIVDRIIKVCMLATSIYVIASRWSLARSVARNVNIGTVAFFALAATSAAWSIAADATILRLISLVSILLTCFAISLAGWHRLRFQQVVVPPLLYIFCLSLVLGMIYPERIKEIGDDISLKDAWHGLTLTKNQFGMTASIGVILFVNRWLSREGRALWAISGSILALICLILSRSNTSLFATMVAVMFMILVMKVPAIKRAYTSPVAIAISATIGLYELVIQNVVPGAYTLLAPVRDLTGKDATFSARTIIWDIVKAHIQGAPYLGTGYGAYWLGPFPGSPSYLFVALMYFYPTESHNGYLEMVNDLGIVGLGCLLLFLVWFIRQALQLMRFDRSQAALYLGLLFQQMVINMSESEWFSRSSTFAILLLASACLSRALHDARLQPLEIASPKH